MSKKVLGAAGAFVFVTVAAFLILNAGLSFADQKAADEISIQSSLWKDAKYGPAKFTHKKHVDEHKVVCQECHHVYKDGKNVWKEGDNVQKCDACHTCVKTGKDLKAATPEEKKLSLFDAYHNNCKGCHAKLNKEKKDKKAPVTCTACHKKLGAKK
jgi:hypothetical protein